MDRSVRQVLAYLHDPPCKFRFLGIHERISETLIRHVLGGEVWESASKRPDWVASASDRLCLPKGVRNDSSEFSHPFSGAKKELGEFIDLESETTKACERCLSSKNLQVDEQLFLLWRFWRSEMLPIYPNCYLWPADTRLPNHSIWNHMGVTAAFAACEIERDGKPNIEASLLTVQFGPVQEWIEQARNTIDCWSGSHIISSIVTAALSSVAKEVGPTAILSPDLCGQPLFDLSNREFLEGLQRWEETESGKNVQLLKIASIPHRFTCLVPSCEGEEIAKKAISAARDKWLGFADSAWNYYGIDSIHRAEWDRQIANWLNAAWQLTPINNSEKTIEIIEKLSEENKKKADACLAEYNFAMSTPNENADTRNYANYYNPANGFQLRLNRDGEKIITVKTGAWEAIVHHHEQELAARRSARYIPDNLPSYFGQRDELDGKSPVIAPDWQKAKRAENGILKKNDLLYGAPFLVKRAYPVIFKEKTDVDISVRDTNSFGKTKHFAVLSMDGDDMGKWASGGMNNTWGEDLPQSVQQYLRNVSDDNDYQESLTKLLASRRSLRPSQMLQFSEALKNFSTLLVDRIIEKHDGYLIYSGGDDLMAFLPPENSIRCAYDIQRAFSTDYTADGRILPGAKMKISAGLAIAHHKEPLQSVIRSSREALNYAKKIKGQTGAMGVSLIKRSGEKVLWRISSDVNVVSLSDFMESNPIPKTFPKKLDFLLRKYFHKEQRSLDSFEGCWEILLDEIHHCVKQMNIKENGKEIEENFKNEIDGYFNSLKNKNWASIDDFLGPFSTYDFIRRKIL